MRIQFVSSCLYQPGHSGTGTYVLSILGYLQHQGCKIEYTSLDPTPGGRRPWYVIPRELAAVGTISVRRNLRIGRLLLRRASVGTWLKELLTPLYTHLGSPVRFLYHALRPTPITPVSPSNDSPPSSLGCIPAPDEIAYVQQQVGQIQPDVVIANRIHLASVLDFTSTKNSDSAAKSASRPSLSASRLPLASYRFPLTALLTHEVMHQREVNLIAAGLMRPEDRFWTMEKEIAFLGKADVLLPIQEDDAAETRRLVPGKEVLTVPMATDVPTPTSHPQVIGRCLYVGGNNICSAQGLIWFLEEIWPLIRSAVPTASLHVAGIVHCAVKEQEPDLYQQSQQHGVTYLGRIPDLAPEYSAAQVVVIPLLSGSGLKIKLIEALSYGRAIVSTQIGVQGVAQQVDEIVKVADEPQTFAKAVTELLADSRQRTHREQKARQLITDHYSPEAVYGPVFRRLKELAVVRSPAASSLRSNV